jgi:hypothetical protein
MTMKTVLAALLAAGLFASAAQAPVYAQDADEGTTMDEPMDPGTDDSADAESDASGDGAAVE